jgi:hypothetical protein
MPFRMYHPLDSHVFMIHCALELTMASSLSLLISVSAILGWRFPTRVFQSPHRTERACGGMLPKMSSMSFLATSSSIPRV